MTEPEPTGDRRNRRQRFQPVAFQLWTFVILTVVTIAAATGLVA